jgi:uncharacterized protein (DUF305 family)
MKFRTIALASSALTAVLLLAGCSTTASTGGMEHSATSTPAASSTFNSADETFTMGMIAHHQQAIEMADMLLGKEGVDERVTNLALKIKGAQGPEIDTMNAWLRAWGVASADTGGMDGMNHSGGMMSDEDMTALQNATGAEASTLFLKQMTQHHQGAIEMAQQELDNGENPDALELAQKIIDDQTAEIATMQSILDTL